MRSEMLKKDCLSHTGKALTGAPHWPNHCSQETGDMTKHTAFLVFAAAAGLCALQAADYKGAHAERDEKDVLQLEAQWTKAIQSKDTAALERLLASDYTMVDASGKTLTKGQEIANYRNGALKLDSFATSGQKVIIYIGGAVVTGTATIKGKHGKEDISGEYRFVDVLERRKSGWEAVYSQLTKVETEKDKKKREALSRASARPPAATGRKP